MPNGLLPDAPIGRGAPKPERWLCKKKTPRVSTDGQELHIKQPRYHGLCCWRLFFWGGNCFPTSSDRDSSTFCLLPVFVPLNSGRKIHKNPIPSAPPAWGGNHAGGKKDDTSCVVAEVVEWTKEVGEVACCACFCFAHGWHQFRTCMMIIYNEQSRFVRHVARCCGCVLLWLCLCLYGFCVCDVFLS